MDFGLLPPEINSGRMYTGSGSAPMLAAATAWDGLATELHGMAGVYESAATGLGAGWQGPSAAAMTSAVAPYISWLKTTAAQAEQAAIQARTAATAYEAAFTATVPPPVIAANRSLLLTLIATNILGQNTPAIATAEAHYAQMWAQDATAMYGYAGSAAAAADLSPFTEPPRTADPAGSARQARLSSAGQLSRLTRAVPQAMRNLTSIARPAAAAAAPVESLLQGITEAMSALTGPYSPLGHLGLTGGWWLFFGQILALAQNPPGVAGLLAAPKAATGAFAPISGYLAAAPSPAGFNGPVSAALSRAGRIGALSVPSAWAGSAPPAHTVGTVLSGTTTAGPAAAEDGSVGALGAAAALSGLTARARDAVAARSATGPAPRIIGTAAAYTLAPDTVPDAAGEVTIIVVPASEQPTPQ
ncbi:PPE family protein [Mycobacterium sp. M1]|uniref:PPE family protein n=1 Tax=Mycolicibacter acidiphilus TaxID=2835306 RepID=A0ABS5RGC4_9MYCO|nr:PPE family protein [Mycolicibacter acidiphilus]MBS9533343.1 PPE family protein [Mycolicibacter acidiphilus]